jgi:hypothetical protein
MEIKRALIETAKETLMTYTIFAAIVALTLIMSTGCGSGGVPGGDQTINISTSQDQSNNQNQSTGTEKCSDSCQIDASSGDIVQVRECEGSPLQIVASFATTRDCKTAVATDQESEAAAQ